MHKARPRKGGVHITLQPPGYADDEDPLMYKRTKQPKPYSVTQVVFGVVGVAVVIVLMWVTLKSLHAGFSSNLFAPSGALAQMEGGSRYVDSSAVQATGKPSALIVLSDGKGRWNTGVWSGWGEGRSGSDLRWAAHGTRVNKKCPYDCHFTHDNSQIPDADAVIMEVINHPKFLHNEADSVPLAFPEKSTAMLGMLYNEPTEHWKKWVSNPEIRDRFDFIMHTDQGVNMPITTICNWGRNLESLLTYDPQEHKKPQHDIVYFCDHGVAPEYQRFVSQFVQLAQAPGSGLRLVTQQELSPSAPTDGGTYNTPWRLGEYSKYKFALITEASVERDWVSLDYSQALVGGAVPVYIGASNIEEFVPGTSASPGIIDIRGFESDPARLVDHLRALVGSYDAYLDLHAWRRQSRLSPQFLRHLDRCVYYAECRICEKVLTTKRG
eukprot:TRINITY_DN5391_c0_g1_i1.p1 TRINITY_DN5391_c0_g1~~TRINITY_DN5391_c0_g1_i1.p1  ORF type:complete len:438 (-),score=36.85 TRINITY_DN5391_c0_g1_i1:121-1434(-)